MTNLGIQKQNIYTTDSTQTAAVSASNTSNTIELVDKSVVEAQGNVDVANTGNTSKRQRKVFRSIEEVYKAIEPICTRFGLNIAEVKKAGLIEKIANADSEVLQKIKNSEVQTLLKCLEMALVKLSKESNGKIDLEKLAELGKQYYETKRTPDDMYEKISDLCAEYGLDLREAKEKRLLQRISGYKLEVLARVEDAEFEKIMQALEAALKKLSANGKKIDMKELAELANDYNVALHTGWTIENFEKAQAKGKESLTDRLKRMTKYPNISLEDAIADYFNGYFADRLKKALEGVTDPKEREKIINNEKKIQLQDFGRLLANSSKAERREFLGALKSLYASNRLEGLEAILKSCKTEEEQTEIADSCDADFQEDLYESVDPTGEKPAKEEVSGISQVVARNQSEEGRRNTHGGLNEKAKTFFEENKEIIARIQEKMRKQEPLTEEEQAIKDKIDGFFTPVTTGEIIGTAENFNISEDVKIDIISTINEDAFDKPNYRDILTLIAEQTDETKNPNNNLLITKAELTKLLDKSTNGNYTTVVTDIANGTKSELAPPANIETQPIVATTITETPVQTGSLGFEVGNSVDTGYAKALTERLYTQTPVELLQVTEQPTFVNTNQAPETFAESLKTGIKGIKQYVSKANVSNKEITLNILNATSGVGAIVKEWALDKFEKMSRPIQRMTFEGIENNASAIAAAQRMSAEDLQKMNFQNHYLKTNVENIIEEKEEIA